MKKIVLFYLALLIPSIILYSFVPPDDDCHKKFHTGHYTLQGQEGKYKLVRVEGMQTEIFNDSKSKIISDMKWISDTEYHLTLKKLTNVAGCLKKGDVVKVKIVSCEGSKITCEYTTDKCGKGTQVFLVSK
ncbi:MAG: hypothetical protein ACOZCO_12190 [Bacteroidota bacterium]